LILRNNIKPFFGIFKKFVDLLIFLKVYQLLSTIEMLLNSKGVDYTAMKLILHHNILLQEESVEKRLFCCSLFN